MSDAPHSAHEIEAAIDAHRPSDVKQQLNSDYLRSSPQEFAAVVKQMELDGKARVVSASDGTVSKVSLKDGYLEFAGIGGTTVFDKDDYPNNTSLGSHLTSLGASGGLGRVINGALDTGKQEDK